MQPTRPAADSLFLAEAGAQAGRETDAVDEEQDRNEEAVVWHGGTQIQAVRQDIAGGAASKNQPWLDDKVE
jgi:hypothetical protein